MISECMLAFLRADYGPGRSHISACGVRNATVYSRKKESDPVHCAALIEFTQETGTLTWPDNRHVNKDMEPNLRVDESGVVESEEFSRTCQSIKAETRWRISKCSSSPTDELSYSVKVSTAKNEHI
jgi:hypothetical protein